MSATEPLRPEPEALLKQASGEGRGRLKIFLGMAPGVGKTFAMLESAQRLQSQGKPVLVGIIETHGRAETEALLNGLEILPRRTISYRGHNLQEFDLDAALARRPKLLLVDELAHSNPEGSRHPKRWQDIEELRAAGIDVHTTLNIQHLESLNDVVARITGVRVRETVPDRVLAEADEVELIDLTPTELNERLHQGKVYAPHLAGHALERFFRPGNLAALRELALRRTAERVDDEMVGYMRAHAIEGPWPVSERIMVCIGTNSLGPAVVREGKRLADQMNVPWVVVHVETPSGALQAKQGDNALAEALSLTQRLGGQAESLIGEDMVGELLRYAKRRNITQIVIGRSSASRWRALLGRSLVQELVRRAEGIAIHVLTPALPKRQNFLHWPQFGMSLGPYMVSTGAVAAVIALAHLIPDLGRLANVSMLFLGAVLLSAVLYGVEIAIFASLLAFMAYNFFFTQPYYTLQVEHWSDLLALLVFLIVAIVTGTLAGRVRMQVRAAQARMAALQTLYDFARRVGATVKVDELLHAIVLQIHRLTGRPAMILLPEGPELTIRYAWPPDDHLDEAARAAARWAKVHAEPAGAGTDTLPLAGWSFRPMRTGQGVMGVLGLAKSDPPYSQETIQTLDAILDQAAVAIERLNFAADAARMDAMAETERLRNALLSSISHDLRTPLTSILGSVTSLQQDNTKLSEQAQRELLATIEEEAERLNRFVHNLLDTTRLESGALEIKRDWLDPAEVIEAAVKRIDKNLGSLRLRRDMAPDLPLIKGDFLLLETIFFNLFDNAVKHAQASMLTIGAHKKEAELIITISDDGVGIPKEHLPRLFDKFFRVNQGDAKGAGTGLGLSIAKGFVEAMGGRIEACSPVIGARGTSFTLAFPLEAQPMALEKEQAP